MQENWVQSLSQKDPLKRKMATHSSIFAWRIPWTGAWWVAVQGPQRVRHNLTTKPPPPPRSWKRHKICFHFQHHIGGNRSISLEHCCKCKKFLARKIKGEKCCWYFDPKRNQPWIFTGRTDAEAEAPILGHLLQRADFLKKPWRWERLQVGEGDDRVWDV